MADLMELCKGDKCGNCLISGDSYVVTDFAPSLQVGREVGVAVFGAKTDGMDPLTLALAAARAGATALRTISGDGCYYTMPDGSVRNER